jgi:putative hydrolase of the HAD superfamily
VQIGQNLALAQRFRRRRAGLHLLLTAARHVRPLRRAGALRKLIVAMDRIGHIKAVIFDLDQTLTDRDKSMRKMAEVFAGHFAPDLRPCSFETVHSAMKRADARGFRPRPKFAGDLLEMLPWKSQPKPETLIAFWEEKFPICAVERAGSGEVLEELLGRGLKLGVLTNGETIPQKTKLKVMGFEPFFASVLISRATGTKKPEPAFYQLALDALGCTAETVVFVGDHPHFDVVMPQQLGMNAVWLKGIFDWPADVPPPVYSISELKELPTLL